MRTPSLTLIALDIDGVLNPLERTSATTGVASMIGEWMVQRHQPVIDRLRRLLALPGVEGAWLTTWLEMPWLLDQFEEELGLTGLVPHRAPHPSARTRTGGTAFDGRFDADVSFSSASQQWWKIRSAELLIDQVKPSRFAWLDDDLNRAGRPPGDIWRPGVSRSRFLFAPNTRTGLTAAQLDDLEEWLRASEVDAGVGDETKNSPPNGPTDDARDLINVLGPTLVATLSGVDRSIARTWMSPDGDEPTGEVAERLLFARETWQRVSDAEGDDVARAWFVGGNPWLKDDTAIMAIREGRFAEVTAASQALVDDSWSG